MQDRPSPQLPLQSNGPRLKSPDAMSSPNRKTLEAKATARKTAARRRPFHPADRGLNQSASAENHLDNGNVAAKTSLQGPLDQPLQPLGSPARKKQRTISPTLDAHSFNQALSASPLAPPRAFAYGGQNGDLPAIPGRLPTLTDDHSHAFPQRARAIPSSYDDYIRAPITSAIAAIRTDSSRLNGEPSGTASRSSFDEAGPSDVSRNASFERAQPSKAPTPAKVTSTKTTPTKARTAQSEKAPTSRFSKIQPLQRTPPLEKQRRRLVEEADTSVLDAFIYSQQGSSQFPPPGVERQLHHQEPAEPPEPKKQGNLFLAHMDPRTHRSRPHSNEWYRKKEEEIKARGGRKANFGKAVQRMKHQRQQETRESFEASLPDRVRQNEDWVAALAWFRGQNGGLATAEAAAPAAPVRTKRQYIRRKPLPEPGTRAPASGP